MKKSKFRVLLMASVMIMLCAALIVGGTYALWSDNVTSNNHLTAGTLDVKLERIGLTKTYADSTTGYLVTDEDATVVDLSGSTSVNVFGIGSSDKLVPCSAYTARLKLTNNGDVVFTYDVIIKLTSVSNQLAQQLKVYVAEDDGELVAKGYLSEFVNGGAAIIASQTMAKNTAAKEFTVKIEFVDNSAINNSAQSQTADFDLVVNAVQGNAEVVDPVFVNSSASLEGAALSSAFDDLGEDGKGTVMLMLTDDVRKTKIVEYQDVFENDLTDGQNLVLDLAGNTVYTTPKLFRVNSGATLTIKSSVPGGKLIVNNNVGGNRFGISVEESGTLNIEDGVIIEVLAFEVSNPGAISCSGTVNMNGGEIIVHDTIAVWMWGSATGSAFNMNGGKISLAPDAEDVGGVGIAVVNMDSKNTYELHLNAGSIVGKGVAYDVDWATQGGAVTQSDAFVIDVTPVTTGD